MWTASNHDALCLSRSRNIKKFVYIEVLTRRYWIFNPMAFENWQLYSEWHLYSVRFVGKLNGNDLKHYCLIIRLSIKVSSWSYFVWWNKFRTQTSGLLDGNMEIVHFNIQSRLTCYLTSQYVFTLIWLRWICLSCSIEISQFHLNKSASANAFDHNNIESQAKNGTMLIEKLFSKRIGTITKRVIIWSEHFT